jgi:hypothetical protein
MSSFVLDDNLDLKITNGRISMTTGADAIRQHLRTKLGLFLGEWFLDTTIGVPWFRDVLVKNPNIVVIQDMLKDQILSTQGVIEITRFDFDYQSANRFLRVDFTVLTTEGFIDFSQEVGGI